MAHQLAHLEDFQKVLKDYRVSAASQTVLAKTKLVLLTAPTSVGRNTIIRELLKTGEYYYIVSDTTRPPRVNDGVLEQDGVEYWFRDETAVLDDLQQGKFLEAAIIHQQQVSGISIREIEKASETGKVAITDIEIVGTHNIVAMKPDTIVLFMLPPSFEEWQRRIKGRGQMSELEFRRRMSSAAEEFRTALTEPYYHFVLNDTIDHAVQQVHELAVEGVTDKGEQAQLRQLLESLLQATTNYVKENSPS